MEGGMSHGDRGEGRGERGGVRGIWIKFISEI